MLHSLGPFRLEPINFAAIEFSKEGARYSINLTQELRYHGCTTGMNAVAVGHGDVRLARGDTV